jgi:DnaJ-class molecular chaperone
LSSELPNLYATLGLDRRCTLAQIRAAYRLLAKQHHPDRNPEAPESLARTQELNAAYETLSDTSRRRVYDRDLDASKETSSTRGTRKIERNISQDVHLPIEAFFRGTALEVRVKDPANPNGTETYRLGVPPATAPGARFRLPRRGPSEGGVVALRVKVLPGFRFKARGSDLRCDLRISAQRATQGGSETIQGPAGTQIRVPIPPHVSRGEVLRLRGEGLPKPRGGRGDLLIRITYRPEVRVSRSR